MLKSVHAKIVESKVSDVKQILKAMFTIVKNSGKVVSEDDLVAFNILKRNLPKFVNNNKHNYGESVAGLLYKCVEELIAFSDDLKIAGEAGYDLISQSKRKKVSVKFCQFSKWKKDNKGKCIANIGNIDKKYLTVVVLWDNEAKELLRFDFPKNYSNKNITITRFPDGTFGKHSSCQVNF